MRIETCRGMASAAHTYGKPIVGAESFTANDAERWQEYPGVDQGPGRPGFLRGDQPLRLPPLRAPALDQPRPQAGHDHGTVGSALRAYARPGGTDAKPWHEYLARCQFLLRQGHFAADLCYLQPESPFQSFQHHPRLGYDWDECASDVVLNRMAVQDGRLVLPDGMSYRLLVLPESRTMTPALLRKIRELVAAGATVLGPRPEKSPSLSDFPACDDEVKHLAADLWGDCDGQKVKEHAFGNGRIVWGITPENWLKAHDVPADFPARRGFARFIARPVGPTSISWRIPCRKR